VVAAVPPLGSEMRVDGVAVRVLHPDGESANGDNDSSLTLRLRRPTAVLRPGDPKRRARRRWSRVGARACAARC
jgi:hypothetical protein